MKEYKRPMGDKQAETLGKTVLGMLAVGLTAGFALIATAKKVGDTFFDKQDEAANDEE